MEKRTVLSQRDFAWYVKKYSGSFIKDEVKSGQDFSLVISNKVYGDHHMNLRRFYELYATDSDLIFADIMERIKEAHDDFLRKKKEKEESQGKENMQIAKKT